MMNYEDTWQTALKMARSEVYGDNFNCSRYMPGQIAGEWLLVDDRESVACIVNLQNKEVMDGLYYPEVIEKYESQLIKA